MLQETCTAGPFFHIFGGEVAKTLVMNGACERLPVSVCGFHGDLENVVWNAFLAQFHSYSNGALAPIYAGTNESFSHPQVALKALGPEAFNLGFHNVRVPEATSELVGQLTPAMLAASKMIHGGASHRHRI